MASPRRSLVLLLLAETAFAQSRQPRAEPAATAPPRHSRSEPTKAARRPLQLKLPRYPSGKVHDLAADRGKVVLLDVWATWCEPCQVALPLYERLLKQYGKRGFRVYTISVDEDQDDIGPFVKMTKLSLPILLDPEAEVSETKLRVRMMPTSFVLDRGGRIRHMHEGFDPDSLAKYQEEIEALLAEKTPAEAHADP